MNKKSWIIFSILILGFLVSLVIFSDDTRLDVSTVDYSAVQEASDQNGNIADHVFGNVDSKVTLINYGDFQCPGCGSMHPIIKKVVEDYKNEIRFIFRNFVLSYHQNAKAASATAEAAGLQGKYWEMHNKIYESQLEWEKLNESERYETFVQYAKDLKLNITKFKDDIATPSMIKKINYDYALGKSAGVKATPSFYLNGVLLEESAYRDESTLKGTIDAELKKTGIPLPQSNN